LTVEFDLPCSQCGTKIEIDDAWDMMGEIIECPDCGQSLVLEFEEIWDGEEERHIWWLEEQE